MFILNEVIDHTTLSEMFCSCSNVIKNINANDVINLYIRKILPRLNR